MSAARSGSPWSYILSLAAVLLFALVWSFG